MAKINFLWVNRHTIVDVIEYGEHQTPFGNMLVGITQHGICSVEFVSKKLNKEKWLKQLAKQWRKTQLVENVTTTQTVAELVFAVEKAEQKDITLHIQGSPFQQMVWQELLEIPFGKTASYGEVAQSIGNPTASRAVGSAVGANPVAILVPCHRVLRSNGDLGGYRWGEAKKNELLDWEIAKTK